MTFLGTRCSVDDPEPTELRAVPSFNIASHSALAIPILSDSRRRGRLDTGGPGVVLMWCTVLCRTSRWTPEWRVRSGNSAKMSSAGRCSQ